MRFCLPKICIWWSLFDGVLNAHAVCATKESYVGFLNFDFTFVANYGFKNELMLHDQSTCVRT